MDMAPYGLVALVSVLALAFYLGLILKIGMTRGKLNLSPADAQGDAAFERLCRVQVNTSEQLILFLPALWLFAIFLSPKGAAILGAVWIVGRFAYARGYAQAFEKRKLGFLLTILASFILLVGALIGVANAAFVGPLD